MVAAAGAGCASTGEGGAAAEKEYTQEEEMAAWNTVANPGPEHARMAAEAGDWTVKSTAWMAPGAPPMESVGSARIHMVLDGRFQVMEYEGNMMDMSFKGMGTTGYDILAKKYVGTWCDSMGTMIMISEGTRDASGAVTMWSEWNDPLGRRTVSRMVSTMVDADHMHMEMHCRVGSKPETKVMELDFTRKK